MTTDPRLIETFNTHNLSDKKVRALLTGREREREAILSAVRANLERRSGQLQHVALYGPRGFGKSFMTRVIEIDVAADPRAAQVAYLLLPEEQHNLARSPEALLKHFATRLSSQGGDWEGAAFTWPKGDAAERWRSAAETLEAAIDARFGPGRGLVIAVVENFDFLIHDVFGDSAAEERLRKWMTRRDNRVMLFVTATGHVDMEYDRPLFQAFKPVHLDAWTDEDCVAYFNRRRALSGGAPYGPDTLAKARAVAEFIGGNPRLAQLLGSVLETDDALGVADLLNALADELADYYRRRIDDLPPYSRGLLDALVRGGEPCSETALAKRVGSDQKTIARAFGVLVRADIVGGRRATDSKEKLFSVRDRVFVHFYRVRYGGVSRDASPLVYIVEFLEAFYSATEKRDQAARYLELGLAREARVFLDMVRSRSSREFNRYVVAFRFRMAKYLRAFPDAQLPSIEEIMRLLTDPERLYTHAKERAAAADSVPERVLWLIVRAQAAERLPLGTAKQLLETATSVAEGNADAGFVAADEACTFEWCVTKDKAAVLERWLAAAEPERPSLRAIALGNRAFAKAVKGEHVAALALATAAERAAREVGDLHTAALATSMLARALDGLGRKAEGAAAFAAAASLAEQAGDNDRAATELLQNAWRLVELHRYEEAAYAAGAAAQLSRAVGNTREERDALMLQAARLINLGEYASAAPLAQAALALAHRHDDRWELEWSLAYCLGCAAVLRDERVVDLFAELLASSRLEAEDDRPPPQAWLPELVTGAIRARSWRALVDLIDRERPWFAEEIVHLDPTAFARAAETLVATTAHDPGRGDAFAAALAILHVLAVARSGEVDGQRRHAVTLFLSSFLNALISASADPGLLRDVADAVETRLGQDAPSAPVLLRTVASLREPNGSTQILERVDPDIASTVRRLLSLGESEPKR